MLCVSFAKPHLSLWGFINASNPQGDFRAVTSLSQQDPFPEAGWKQGTLCIRCFDILEQCHRQFPGTSSSFLVVTFSFHFIPRVRFTSSYLIEGHRSTHLF